jgi:hypothetical protein
LLSTREERRSRKKMLTWLQNPNINSFFLVHLKIFLFV